MRFLISLLLATLLASFIPLQEKEPALLSTQLKNDDWEIRDWSAIRRGQLSVIHARGGDELHVYELGTTLRGLAPSSVGSQSPAFDGNCFLVSHFDSGNTNRLGGYFNSFQRAPSAARAALRTSPEGRRGLTLDFLKTGSGFCGVWVHLFDFKFPAEKRTYFDASPFSVLTFWIRGQEGGEKILLKVSDARWERKEDALPAGEVGSFLPQGKLNSSWQQVVVPLSSLPRQVNPRELAGLIFEALNTGRGQIQIKDLAFCVNREPLPALSAPVSRPERAQQRQKAVWVWNTSEILNSQEKQLDLMRFLEAQGFTHLFLQLPNEKERIGLAGEVTLEAEKLRPLIASISRRGIQVHALDGFKNYALPEWHERVLLTLENVVRYNQASDRQERFSGVHYDIEPYLLPGFVGPRRQRVLQGYLELLERISQRARQARLVFGADIPFWYDAADELTGEIHPVEFHGVRKFASQHVIDLVDQVAIMDYRTTAYGADGIIALAQDELFYAAEKGKQVFIGMETTELPDEELVEFEGEPSREFSERAPGSRFVLLAPGKAGSTLYLVSASQWPVLKRDFHSRNVDLNALFWWSVRRTVAVPGHKLSFSALGADRLHEAMAEAQDELAAFSSFTGFAIHDYLGYRRLLKSTLENSR